MFGHGTKFVTVRPHQVGWLRRPELDTPGHYVWEKPNGELQAFAFATEPVLHVLKPDTWPLPQDPT